MEGSGVGIAGCVVHGDVHGEVVLQKKHSHWMYSEAKCLLSLLVRVLIRDNGSHIQER